MHSALHIELNMVLDSRRGSLILLGLCLRFAGGD